MTVRRKIFFILLSASLLGVVAILPYAFALPGGIPKPEKLPLPLAALIPLTVLQNGVFFAVVIGVGLWAANR